jgi:hypothetical protein
LKINYIKVFTLTALVSALTIAQTTPVNAISTPPLETQIKQVAQWFAGLFDNSQQVAATPSIPLITLSSCSVQLTNAEPTIGIQNVYLEQQSINRFRLYSFSPGNSAVNLSIRGFTDNSLFSGLCNRPESEQIVDYSQVLQTSCELEIFWDNGSYTGNNAPNGCPTSTNGKVVSRVTLTKNTINSFDQIFGANGNLLVATPIEFRRAETIPEPSFILGLFVVGVWKFKQFQAHKN